MAVVTACVAGAAVIAGGLVNANQAKQAARGFANEAERKAWEIEQIEANRQKIPNPYEGVKSIANTFSNPYANMGVSTKAAEMQAEEADISLANTLDLLKSTGASAGGATALAQAALQSKKGVSASIEQQEAKNEQLKAQGQENLNQMILQDEQRVQALEAEGIKFKYGEQESRDIAKLNRLSGQQAQAQANAASAKNSENAAYGSIFSGIGNIAGGMISAGGSGGGKKG
jgi:hypothetical protein